jgi:hypothetical protein
MRRLLVILTLGAALAAVPAADAVNARTCGYIHASVPYSQHGHADRWRVYVWGSASCEDAETVLDAVMHLHGNTHNGGSEASSYITDRGWLCPFGNMGQQSCELPTRLPSHPPIRAHAVALDCSVVAGGCPARYR